MTVTKGIDMRGPTAPAAEAPPLARVGSYEVLAPLARGGGGSVWLAFDRKSPEFLRVVAIKFLHRSGEEDDDELRRRFLREARIGSAIRHTNVVEVYEVGEEEDQPYLVMPYVEGVDARVLERSGPLPIAVAVSIVADTLRGLEAAHAARTLDGKASGVVHRDVSPHNLLVGVDGVTKVTDFGIARPLEGPDRSLTGWGQGKVAYFSPEQSRGEALDRRSDLFATGTVLWELLAGRSLFRDDDPFVTAHRVQSLRIPAPSGERRAVPEAFDAVTAKALARAPDERYATAGAMLSALLDAAAAAGVVLAPEIVAAYVREHAAEPLAERAAILRAAAALPPGSARALSCATSVRADDAVTATAPTPMPLALRTRTRTRRRRVLLLSATLAVAVALMVVIAGRRAPDARPAVNAAAPEPSPSPTFAVTAPPPSSAAVSTPSAHPAPPPARPLPVPRDRRPRAASSTAAPKPPALPMTVNPF